MRILYSSRFAREYEKLPNRIKNVSQVRESMFRKNPFDRILATHKLHGRLSDFWSFSIGFRYRIIFEFAADDEVHFHSVGNHDVYQ